MVNTSFDILHAECTRKDGVFILSSPLFYHLLPLPRAIALSSFGDFANRVQHCVKIHKQHLQQWQPGTPSVPRSPAKSAHVPSHLLGPSSHLSPLPCCFHCRRIGEDPSFIMTVDLAQAAPALWNGTEPGRLQCWNTIGSALLIMCVISPWCSGLPPSCSLPHPCAHA